MHTVMHMDFGSMTGPEKQLSFVPGIQSCLEAIYFVLQLPDSESQNSFILRREVFWLDRQLSFLQPNAGFSLQEIRIKLDKMVNENKLRHFYPPQRLDQLAQEVSRLDVAGLGQRWKLPKEVSTRHLLFSYVFVSARISTCRSNHWKCKLLQWLAICRSCVLHIHLLHHHRILSVM